MYRVINDNPIKLSHISVDIETVMEAIELTNQKFRSIADSTRNLALDVFSILDLRVLSGAVGETFVGEMARCCNSLRKNPSIDGYPDLVQCTNNEMLEYFRHYAETNTKEEYIYGGIEVKNTFGYKQRKIDLFTGEQRVGKIKEDLEWKAHHQKTNHLLGLYSDYIDGYPTIVAAFYSDQLEETDWSKPSRPTKDSTMTSFSTLQTSGFQKMLSGIRVCLDDYKYLTFLDRRF